MVTYQKCNILWIFAKYVLPRCQVWRQGPMVIATAFGIEERGFESRLGMRYLRAVVCGLLLCVWGKINDNRTFL
jgi:hypothetical protein